MTIWNSADLTIDTVTSLFLYGTSTVPSNLQSDALIRSSITTTTISVDAVSFMSTGPGRFAKASESPLVSTFFTTGQTIASGQYTKAQMEALLGISDSNSNIVFNQYNFDDGNSDYLQRSYIYDKSSFAISSNTTFVVDADGARHIQNLSIRPFDDNFDFAVLCIKHNKQNLAA